MHQAAAAAITTTSAVQAMRIYEWQTRKYVANQMSSNHSTSANDIYGKVSVKFPLFIVFQCKRMEKNHVPIENWMRERVEAAYNL